MHKLGDEQLTLVTSTYNMSTHDITQCTPNFLIYGCELNMAINIVYGTMESAKYDGLSDYVNDLRNWKMLMQLYVHNAAARLMLER